MRIFKQVAGPKSIPRLLIVFFVINLLTNTHKKEILCILLNIKEANTQIKQTVKNDPYQLSK